MIIQTADNDASDTTDADQITFKLEGEDLETGWLPFLKESFEDAEKTELKIGLLELGPIHKLEIKVPSTFILGWFFDYIEITSSEETYKFLNGMFALDNDNPGGGLPYLDHLEIISMFCCSLFAVRCSLFVASLFACFLNLIFVGFVSDHFILYYFLF